MKATDKSFDLLPSGELGSTCNQQRDPQRGQELEDWVGADSDRDSRQDYEPLFWNRRD
jgi:hypothetical protein